MNGRGDGGLSPFARLLGRLSAWRALRWNLVELCRRTGHEGWERLQAAEAAGRGVVLLVAAGTPWGVAARALAAWAGPLHLALPAGTADRRLARRLLRGDGGAPRIAEGAEAIRRALAAGGKVLFVVEAGGPAEPPHPELPAGVPVLPVAVEALGRGRYRLAIGETGPADRLWRGERKT